MGGKKKGSCVPRWEFPESSGIDQSCNVNAVAAVSSSQPSAIDRYVFFFSPFLFSFSLFFFAGVFLLSGAHDVLATFAYRPLTRLVEANPQSDYARPISIHPPHPHERTRPPAHNMNRMCVCMCALCAANNLEGKSGSLFFT